MTASTSDFAATCPRCLQSKVRFLERLSAVNAIPCFACDDCKYTWATSTARPGDLDQAVCPQCLKPFGRHLEGASRGAWIDYFYCDDCGNHWTVKKGTARLPSLSVRRD